jgi:hypothetical protein
MQRKLHGTREYPKKYSLFLQVKRKHRKMYQKSRKNGSSSQLSDNNDAPQDSADYKGKGNATIKNGKVKQQASKDLESMDVVMNLVNEKAKVYCPVIHQFALS